MLAAAIQSRPLRRPALFRWVQPLGEAGTYLTIGGVTVTTVPFNEITIEDNRGIDSNTMAFPMYGGTKPVEGQPVVYVRGGALTKEFSGFVTKVVQYYDGIRHNIAWRVSCQDTNYVFNDERYTLSWPGAVPADEIAEDIVNLGGGDFDSSGIEAGLPDVEDFQIVLATRGEALQQLQDLVPGATFKVDYDRDVAFYVTPSVVDPPDDLDDLTLSGDRLQHSGDINQARTRQRGLGLRVRIPLVIPAGSTAIALDTVENLPTSGELLVGAQLLAFSGRSQSQSVSGIVGAAGAPTVALASSPAGGVLGAVRYCITAELPDGETPLGTQSSQVTGATVAAPSAGTAALQHQNGGSGPGTPKDYYVNSGTITRSSTSISFTLSGAVAGARVHIMGTSSGVWDGTWTIASVSGTTVTINGVSSAGPASDTGYWQFITAGPLVGVYNYKIGFLSPRGITALSSAFSATGVICAASIGAPTVTNTTGGSLTVSSVYYYYYTLFSDDGRETSPIAWFNIALAGADNAASLLLPQLQPTIDWDDQRVRGLRIYRGRAGEQLPRFLVQFTRETLRSALYDAFSGNWTYVDQAADTSLGALPQASVFGSAIGVSGLPSWSDARITGLAVLRTIAGGSDYYLHSTINSASVGSFTDTMSDEELLQNSPVPATSFGGHSVNLSAIPTPSGATARNIYRLFNGVWRYCGTITNNTDTTFTDSKADTELGAPFKVGGFLTGISATAVDIVAGETGRLHLVRDDAAAQTALAALLGEGDGIQEGPVLSDELLGQDALEQACDAELEVFSASLKSISFRSRDVNLKAGKTVTVNLGGTTNLAGDFLIQRVVSTEFDKAVDLLPLRTVTAGPVLLTLRNRLRRGGSPVK